MKTKRAFRDRGVAVNKARKRTSASKAKNVASLESWMIGRFLSCGPLRQKIRLFHLVLEMTVDGGCGCGGNEGDKWNKSSGVKLAWNWGLSHPGWAMLTSD